MRGGAAAPKQVAGSRGDHNLGPMHTLRSLMLGPPRRTLAVAESLTCGRVQAEVGAISGASEFFLGGITAYALEQKVRHLGVDRHEAEACACVSPVIARQMALGACRLFGSDVGLATTGYAEPDPAGGVLHPIAYWAIAYRDVVVHEARVERPGLGRVAMQEAVAADLLAQLIEVLRSTPLGR